MAPVTRGGFGTESGPQVDGRADGVSRAFSEATAVFGPRLLDGLVKGLRPQARQQGHRQRVSGLPQQILDASLEPLVAVDASVLWNLPQIVSRLGRPHHGQWRLHAEFRVADGTVTAAMPTQEHAAGSLSEQSMATKPRNRAAGERNHFERPTGCA